MAPPIARILRRDHAPSRASGIGGPGNAAGLPAITLPNGLGERGLPTGMQLVGRVGNESQLLAIAQAYQEATTWHALTPPAIL